MLSDEIELYTYLFILLYCFIYMINARRRRKETIRKKGPTNNKANQHSTPRALTFPKINDLPCI